MSHLYFVRHGKTQLNLLNHVQGGKIDSPLLSQSLVDAAKTGEALKTKQIQQVIVSPQKRAIETAKQIVQAFPQSVPITLDSRFIEFCYGTWEGKSISKLAADSPDIFYALRNAPDQYNPSTFDGETYPSLIKRGIATVTEAVAQFPNQNLLFVGHSITLTATLLTLLNTPLKDLRSKEPLANTSISVLSYQANHYDLIAWNQTEHL